MSGMMFYGTNLLFVQQYDLNANFFSFAQGLI